MMILMTMMMMIIIIMMIMIMMMMLMMIMMKMMMMMNLARYQEQSEKRDRITSSKMVTNWVRSDEDLVNNIQEVTARVGVVLTTLEEEARTVGGLVGEVGRLEEDKETASLVERSLAVYTNLKRERPANRQDDTPRQIAQVVVRLLKRRDSQLKLLCGLLSKLTDSLSSLTDLALAVSLLASDLSQSDTQIYRNQIRRSVTSVNIGNIKSDHRIFLDAKASLEIAGLNIIHDVISESQITL